MESQPGVISLPEGSRLIDGISAAGGWGERVDPLRVELCLNLAAPLEDGSAIRIPTRDDRLLLGLTGVECGPLFSTASEIAAAATGGSAETGATGGRSISTRRRLKSSTRFLALVQQRRRRSLRHVLNRHSSSLTIYGHVALSASEFWGDPRTRHTVNSKVRERAPRLAGRSGAAALAALAIAHLFLLPLPSRTLHLLALLLGIGLLLLFVLFPRTNLQRLRAATLGAFLITLRITLFGLPIPPVDVAALPAGVAAAEGEVRALLAPLRGAQRIVLDVSGVRVSVEAPPNPTLRVGDRVSATLEYTSQSPEARERARVRGIQAAARTYSVTLLSRGGPLEWLRTRIGDDLERVIPAPAGGFAAAIVVGLRERVDERLADAFTATGLGHVVALSGWNVAITMAVADRALRRLPLRRRRWSLILIALLYGLFAGASASVIRASVMSAAALVAAAGGRRGAGAVALAHAVLALLILDPSIAYDAGFRLSALATAGLLAKSADWSRVAIQLTPRLPRPLQRPWAVIAEGVAVSIAACRNYRSCHCTVRASRPLVDSPYAPNRTP